MHPPSDVDGGRNLTVGEHIAAEGLPNGVHQFFTDWFTNIQRFHPSPGVSWWTNGGDDLAATKAKSKRWQRWFYPLVAILALVVVGEIAYMFQTGGGSLPVTGRAAEFTARDVYTGRPVSLRSLEGKIVLLTWYYTHCTDLCPLTMYRFYQIQQRLRAQGLFGKKVVLIAMTLDPARDTAPVIRQYGNHFHEDPAGWYFLRATPAQTTHILKAWGVGVKPGADKEFIEHTTKTVLIDQSGNVRATYPTANLNPSQVVTDMQSLVARANWL